MEIVLIVVAAVAVLVLVPAVYAAAVYNRLVKLRERYRNAYAQIDVQLKRRYDLIPNLVEAVKGYMTHERETLEKVIAARNVAAEANRRASGTADPTAVREVAEAESSLTPALGRLLAVREDYPQLKADTQTSRLMEELVTSENRIAFARQHYNDSVTTYNSYRQSFPQTLVAGPAGFGDAALFEVHEQREREAVRVDL